MTDEQFWNATERAEEDFTGSADLEAFTRKMKKLGHADDVIRDRVESIHPSLLKDAPHD